MNAELELEVLVISGHFSGCFFTIVPLLNIIQLSTVNLLFSAFRPSFIRFSAQPHFPPKTFRRLRAVGLTAIY
ncbi:hypothetical protein I7I50_02604 [Histoplasma capsulatum G186AR]|uniref:Uncharacterized protein n=1 Tax=Ajellomyces capsulatus TaxID=5037 RepID=A0A8H8D5Z3_AJECA|nr:hypothetical protein I7I52_00732 [Histoplasma capsulatum]QSS71673.1 hypothetical protein I7I50_02604 [Histoplasma capsulatum G186AR]